MQAHVLTGTKQQIAEDLIQIPGEVREAIVFVDDTLIESSSPLPRGTDDIFAEMLPYMVDVPNVDDSREAIYSRIESE